MLLIKSGKKKTQLKKIKTMGNKENNTEDIISFTAEDALLAMMKNIEEMDVSAKIVTEDMETTKEGTNITGIKN